MNDMLHLPASAGSCAEPVGTGSISRQLAAVAVAIFACMHVCRSPFYVVCFMLQWLADDVSIGVLIRTGSLRMLRHICRVQETEARQPFGAYMHTTDCGARAMHSAMAAWGWAGGGEGERAQVEVPCTCHAGE